jgi:hypothetical protein
LIKKSLSNICTHKTLNEPLHQFNLNLQRIDQGKQTNCVVCSTKTNRNTPQLHIIASSVRSLCIQPSVSMCIRQN